MVSNNMMEMVSTILDISYFFMEMVQNILIEPVHKFLTLISTAFKVSYIPPGRGEGAIWPALCNHGRWTTIPTKLCMMQVSDVLKVW